jgi:SagB-type dehydrogenase family enzyme
MDKLLWVLLPLLLAAAAVAWAWWRRVLPSRMVLNAAFSLLLLVYVLITAGLGIFWVANQHLPVFDWHYLFGYSMLVLLAVHLAFNLRALLHHLRRLRVPAPAASAARDSTPGRRPLVGAFGVLGVMLASGFGYAIGLRHGRTELRIEAGSGAADRSSLALAVVDEFHEFSAHSRAGVLRRAPAAEWGDPPPPFKPMAGERLVLPAQRSTSGAGLDAALLADLLWHAAGVSARSGGILFRTSPSSGALFATELYVAVRALPGVPAAWWHYDVPSHALVRVAPLDAGAPLPGVGPWPPDAAALVLATGIFQRSGHKYRDRTYRYVLGDLGHLLENLRVVAAAASVRAKLLPAFDEGRIATTLGLAEAQEGVLAALLLQPHDAAPWPDWSRGDAGDWQPAALAAADGRLGVTDAIHRATSLQATRAASSGFVAVGRTAPAAERPANAPTIALPAVAAGSVDPLPLIARRRSLRRYATDPLAPDDLAAVLTAMVQPGALLSNAVRIDVVVHAVRGVAPGAWRYGAADHQLERRGEASPSVSALRRRSRAAGLDQDVIGNAAVVFVLSIDRDALAADPFGAARGYRNAFIESGLIGERIYLEGLQRGLGVCAVGAFYDDEATALVGASAREWPVHFAALGRV